MRRLVNKAFLPGTILGFQPRIEQIVTRCSTASRQRTVDIVTEFAMPLPARVIMAMLGVPEDRLDDVKGWSDDIVLFIGTARRRRTSTRAPSGAKAMAGCSAARSRSAAPIPAPTCSAG